MRWMCREPMQLRRPGMSSPDRREIARIHTGGVDDPQYSEAPALGAFFRLSDWVEMAEGWKLTIRRCFAAAPIGWRRPGVSASAA
jgi:hypothetical protein